MDKTHQLKSGLFQLTFQSFALPYCRCTVHLSPPPPSEHPPVGSNSKFGKMFSCVRVVRE